MRVRLPGVASRLPPRPGTQKLWITSTLPISRLTGRPAGRWRSLAVTIPSSGYWNSHHHWWPTTFTRRASLGGSACVRKIAATVGKAMKVRITAGMSVQMSSSVALPRTWRGIAFGSRSRNRNTATRRSACTMRKIAVSHRRICMKMRCEIQAKSDRGRRVVAGESRRPQPASKRPKASAPSRKTGVGRARLRAGFESMSRAIGGSPINGRRGTA